MAQFGALVQKVSEIWCIRDRVAQPTINSGSSDTQLFCWCYFPFLPCLGSLPEIGDGTTTSFMMPRKLQYSLHAAPTIDRIAESEILSEDPIESNSYVSPPLTQMISCCQILLLNETYEDISTNYNFLNLLSLLFINYNFYHPLTISS